MPDEIEPMIEQWRNSLLAAMPDAGDVVAELEDHLRTGIEERIRRGRTPKKAFEESLSRVGTTGGLAKEFCRVRAAGKRRLTAEAVIAALFALTAAGLLVCLSDGLLNRKIEPLLFVHVAIITFGYIAALAMGVVGAVGLARMWRRQVQPDEQLRLARLLAFFLKTSLACLPVGIVLGIFWAKDHLAAAWSWQPVEIGALLILGAVAANAVVHWRGTTDRRRWSAALLCGLAVIMGWWGARLLPVAAPIASIRVRNEARDVAAIDALRTDLDAAINARDADRVAAIFTTDAVYLPQGEQAVLGRAALSIMLKEAYGTSERVPKTRRMSRQITVAGDWAFEWGRVEGIRPKTGFSGTWIDGKYLHVYRRQSDGKWEIARASYNADPREQVP